MKYVLEHVMRGRLPFLAFEVDSKDPAFYCIDFVPLGLLCAAGESEIS
uniref:Uncharacterized protein n=1 Tax=Candidozyma auris TaxID=498019 RepID=A0A0L0P0J8_CANAR